MSTEKTTGEDFARMLDTTVGALRAVRATPEDEEAARERRIGEAADGQVRAEFGADGRLQSVTFDPRLMRLSSAELGEYVVEAVNTAIDAMRGASPAAPETGDLGRLTEQLEEIRDTAVPRLGAFLQALTDAQARMTPGGPR
ncbi:YbaB/EbfC family nucleoid-associated protein [Actinoplanes sp. NPDC051851]|uniref:YbaB/EbfC family nucleoid-associated protein n=1 Tax=Actinoplanes sp. NPDC051851 TaxID=3154753 RepID=UPI0034221291